jgi:hypothetical protein
MWEAIRIPQTQALDVGFLKPNPWMSDSSNPKPFDPTNDKKRAAYNRRLNNESSPGGVSGPSNECSMVLVLVLEVPL